MVKKGMAAIIVIVIIVVVSSSIIVIFSSMQNEDEKKDFWTASELYRDMKTPMSSSGLVLDFKSLDDGDLVVIHDTIYDITYYSRDDLPNTEISLKIDEYAQIKYSFEGNITDEFKIGDKISITYHIKHLEGEITDEDIGETISYVLEFPAEGYDSAYFEEYYNVIMPVSCIEKI